MKNSKKRKRTFPRQIGALVVRHGGSGPEVLLLTSRDTGRWVIPKGWTMPGKADHAAAAREAKEEAGVLGKVGRRPFGAYAYFKRQSDHFEVCRVTVYLMTFERQLPKWREKGQRRLAWCPAREAAEMVREPQLAALIEALPAAFLPTGPAAEQVRHYPLVAP